MQCGHVYLHKPSDPASDLLQLLRLRIGEKGYNHDLTYRATWAVQPGTWTVRLGHIATFFPVEQVLYIRRHNNHSAGALAQYMMHTLHWQVFAFTHDVPQVRAHQAEALAVPMNKWFKATAP